MPRDVEREGRAHDAERDDADDRPDTVTDREEVELRRFMYAAHVTDEFRTLLQPSRVGTLRDQTSPGTTNLLRIPVILRQVDRIFSTHMQQCVCLISLSLGFRDRPGDVRPTCDATAHR